VVVGAGSRAVCRVCGARIRGDEARYGQPEGAGLDRRTRWRHLTCAAESVPLELQGTLALGGWRAVPEHDHLELQRLIDAALGRARWPRSPPALEAEPVRPSASSLAAAVLKPAHDALRLPPERAQAWVFADALQTRGDPRGQWLALELAAEHTADPGQARTLQRERRRLADALEVGTTGLRAGPSLALRWIGGFLIGARPEGTTAIAALMRAPEAETLTRLRLDFCTQDELRTLVDGAVEHGRTPAILDLHESRVSDLTPLAATSSLRRLRVGEGFDPAALGRLESLRALSLLGRRQASAATLALRPELERVELRAPDPGELAGLAEALPRLRWLSVAGTPAARTHTHHPHPHHAPSYCAGARRLEVLRLPDAPVVGLAGLDALPSLTELWIVPGRLGLVRDLAATLVAPAQLARLALRGGKVGELGALAPLVGLRHLALGSTPIDKLGALARLPKLRSLDLDSGDLRRASPLAELSELERLSLRRVTNLDLEALAGLSALRSLTLHTAGGRPRHLAALLRLPRLRALSMPGAWLAALTRADATTLLARLEELELLGPKLPDPALIRALPLLRVLSLPDATPAQLLTLARITCPEVAFVGAGPARDLLDHRDLYDWRAGPWPDSAQGAQADHRARTGGSLSESDQPPRSS